MMRFAEIRQMVAGALWVLAVVALGLVAVFVALWLALAAIAGFFFYALARRFFPGKRRPDPGTNVIEGEYRVERRDRAP